MPFDPISYALAKKAMKHPPTKEPDNVYICLDSSGKLTICSSPISISFPSTTNGGTSISNPSYAVDGDESTYAEVATTTSDYILIDLGELTRLVTRIYVKYQHTYEPSVYVTDTVYIEISKDGSTYEVIHSSPMTNLSIFTVDFRKLRTIRYIRIRWLNRTSGPSTYYIRIYEIKVYTT